MLLSSQETSSQATIMISDEVVEYHQQVSILSDEAKPYIRSKLFYPAFILYSTKPLIRSASKVDYRLLLYVAEQLNRVTILSGKKFNDFSLFTQEQQLILLKKLVDGMYGSNVAGQKLSGYVDLYPN